MTSHASSRNPVAMWFWLALLGLLLACAYTSYKLNMFEYVALFCTGPGSYSRIFAAILLAINWKSLPFAWNVRMPS